MESNRCFEKMTKYLKLIINVHEPKHKILNFLLPPGLVRAQYTVITVQKLRLAGNEHHIYDRGACVCHRAKWMLGDIVSG